MKAPAPFILILLLGCLPLLLCAASRAGFPGEGLQLFVPGESTDQQADRAFAEQRMAKLIRQFEQENQLSQRSRKKAIELIHETVQDQFLRQYDPTAEFVDLFRNGRYNQATAAALYAMVLEFYRIPHLIRGELWEVYVVADPDKRKKRLSAPAGVRRSDLREQAFIGDYVQLLRQLGITGPGQSATPQHEVFRQYYFGSEESLSLSQLAAFVHYQQAQAAYKARRYHLVLEHLDHAAAQAPRPLFEVIRQATLYQLASQGEGGNRKALFYLFELWRQQPEAVLRNEVLRRFVTVADESLFSGQREAVRLDSLYGYMLDKTSADPDLQHRIQEIYFMKKARYHALHNEPEAVRVYLDSLYLYRPDDEHVKELLGNLLVWSLRRGLAPEEGMARMRELSDRYPFLPADDSFRDLDLQYRADHIRLVFDAGQATEGGQLLREFEQLLQRYGPTPNDHLWILTAYLAASNHYYRLQDFSTALQLLQRANALIPGNPYLEHRVEMLRDYYPK